MAAAVPPGDRCSSTGCSTSPARASSSASWSSARARACAGASSDCSPPCSRSASSWAHWCRLPCGGCCRCRGVFLLEIWTWTCCAAFLVWPRAVVLAVSLIPVGLAIPSTDSVVNGYRIAVTPDRLLGRAESVRSAIALSTGALAPLVAGLLLQHSTPRWTVALFAAWAFGPGVVGDLERGPAHATSLAIQIKSMVLLRFRSWAPPGGREQGAPAQVRPRFPSGA